MIQQQGYTNLRTKNKNAADSAAKAGKLNQEITQKVSGTSRVHLLLEILSKGNLLFPDQENPLCDVTDINRFVDYVWYLCGKMPARLSCIPALIINRLCMSLGTEFKTIGITKDGMAVRLHPQTVKNNDFV
jgi:hypothetical protein